MGMAAVAALVACNGSDPGSASLSNLRYLESGVLDDHRNQRVTVAIGECMRQAGFDWSEPSIAIVELQAARGLTGRARFEAIGSGIVAGRIELLRNASSSESTGPSQVEEFYDREAKCATDADERYGRDYPEYQQYAELVDQYNQALPDALRADDEVRTAIDEWNSCMSRSGFDGLQGPGSQLSEIGKRAELAEQSAGPTDDPGVTYSEALTFDIAISLAAFDCDANTRERRNAARQSFDQRFATEHSAELARIADVYGGSE